MLVLLKRKSLLKIFVIIFGDRCEDYAALIRLRSRHTNRSRPSPSSMRRVSVFTAACSVSRQAEGWAETEIPHRMDKMSRMYFFMAFQLKTPPAS